MSNNCGEGAKKKGALDNQLLFGYIAIYELSKRNCNGA